MLNSIRKFSSSPYAKVLLGIVILPFVMWGMGDVFRGGKQNTILEIDKKKFSTQDFGDYVNSLNLEPEDINENVFKIALSNFIGSNLVATHAEKLKITITDDSLAKIIQNNISFKKNNTFSRTAYEKFLISSNLTAYQFEQNLIKTETKNQLLNFISGGVKSPKFLVNREYDSKNQIRNLLIIDLNKIYESKLNFSDDEIKNYYKKNISKFDEAFRSVKYTNVSPKLITGEEQYTNTFFQKLDEIEDLIISDINIDEISRKFNLPIKNTKLFNINGKDTNGKINEAFSIETIKKIFEIKSLDTTVLLDEKENYFLIQLTQSENISKKISSEKVKNKVMSLLKRSAVAVENSKIIEKIITNKFLKTDFDNLALDNNLKIEKIKLSGINDTKRIEEELVKNIYQMPEKKMYVFSDKNLNKNLLVYVNEIKNVTIDKKSKDYKKYYEQTRSKLINDIYKTYDKYLSNKYKVNVNNNAVERVKKYFE